MGRVALGLEAGAGRSSRRPHTTQPGLPAPGLGPRSPGSQDNPRGEEEPGRPWHSLPLLLEGKGVEGLLLKVGGGGQWRKAQEGTSEPLSLSPHRLSDPLPPPLSACCQHIPGSPESVPLRSSEVSNVTN